MWNYALMNYKAKGMRRDECSFACYSVSGYWAESADGWGYTPPGRSVLIVENIHK